MLFTAELAHQSILFDFTFSNLMQMQQTTPIEWIALHHTHLLFFLLAVVCNV